MQYISSSLYVAITQSHTFFFFRTIACADRKLLQTESSYRSKTDLFFFFLLQCCEVTLFPGGGAVLCSYKSDDHSLKTHTLFLQFQTISKIICSCHLERYGLDFLSVFHVMIFRNWLFDTICGFDWFPVFQKTSLVINSNIQFTCLLFKKKAFQFFKQFSSAFMEG